MPYHSLPYRRKKTIYHKRRLKDIVSRRDRPYVGKLSSTGDYVIRFGKSGRKYWKKQTSKKSRKADIPNGNAYRKLVRSPIGT